MSILQAVPAVDELNEMIAEYIEAGGIPNIYDGDVVYEMARRWITNEVKKRKRSSVKTVEVKQKIQAKYLEQRIVQTTVLLETWTEQVSPGWAGTLLAETFSTGDGTEVTWGDATKEQHQSRADWLGEHAASTLETASIHLAAIRDIIASGAMTLGGVVDALVA